MNSTGSVPASRCHMDFGAGAGFGETGNARGVWGTLGIVVWVSQVPQLSRVGVGGLVSNPGWGQRIHAKLPAKMLAALGAPPGMWQQLHPEQLWQDRGSCSPTIAELRPALSPWGSLPPRCPRTCQGRWDTNPSLDVSCILLFSPPSLSCLHPMLQQVLIELQSLTSQRNPLLGKSCSGRWWWNGSSLPPRHSRLLLVQALGVMGLLDFNLNSRGLGVHRIRPFERLMGFYSG